MGGVIIILSVIIPVVLWADVKSTYVILITVGTLWLGAVGFLDDYLKVVKKFPNEFNCKIQTAWTGINRIAGWYGLFIFRRSLKV